MTNQQFASLQNPIMDGLKIAGDRQPENLNDMRLPDGQVVVSADGHWEISDDIFYERFPDRLKDKAPRVWFDRYWHIGHPGAMEAYGTASNTLEEALERCIPDGVWDGKLRERHMQIEGVQKEVVFPQSLLGFVRHKDLEVQEWIYRIYNEYITEKSAQSNGKFFGVGVCSNWWDPEKAKDTIGEIVSLGLKTFIIPVSPGKNRSGADINYASPEMDMFWSTISEAGLPVNFHVGENAFIQEGRGALGTYTLVAFAPFRKPFGQLVFGGVFDRHPDLKVVFTEGGISWVPNTLQDAETIFDSFTELLTPIQHRPSYYWHKNCYATFQNDLLGLKLLDYIGADRVMWANDYPHTEGSFGYTRRSMQSVLEAARSPDEAKMILGGTAMKLYGLA